MTTAQEKSTLVVTVAFTDENGDAVTPTAATWTLTDGQGAVINSRSAVAISSLSTSVTIVLSGDDLAISDPDVLDRVLLVEATYNSSAGSGLPAKKEYSFNVNNLLGVS